MATAETAAAETTAPETRTAPGSLTSQVVDHLQVQAWLAKAEVENPSLHRSPLYEEVGTLAQLRDQMRVQAHLGKMEARERLEHAEARWAELQQKVAAGTDPMSSAVRSLVQEIREAYDGMVH